MRKNATLSRIHDSWLAKQERNLLIWAAARLPPWTTPDHLTLFGVAGALLCGLSFWASSWSPGFLWLACLGLMINWLGDSLDGNLARYRRIERPNYGFFIDHTTDVVSQTFIFVGLGVSSFVRFDMACLMLMSYWMAALYTFIRAVSVRIFQISYFGVGPTEIRLGLILYFLAVIAIGPYVLPSRYGPLSPLDFVAITVFVAVFVSFMSMVWSEGRRIAALEPAPGDPRSRVGGVPSGLKADGEVSPKW